MIATDKHSSLFRRSHNDGNAYELNYKAFFATVINGLP
jgi:hypothetical protein